ncbi:hypothetical protein HY489_06700 [Candidatus Woesearchaeota archaeon]|nr:hypothetical protein [Candidatus Woesearchaeota archaeon]
MDGTELCCRFSGVTNRLKYCGPNQAHNSFIDFIHTRQGTTNVQRLLSRFEGLYPYLKLISSRHKLDLFDYKVIEAYWLGNELLDAFTPDDYRAFLPELVKRGLPEHYAQQSREKMPQGAIPHHTFHVLFVGVGRVTGSVPTSPESMQSCMASWAEVRSVDSTTISVYGPVLRLENEEYILSEQERRVSYDQRMVRPKINDKVAIHWNECVHVLTAQQYENVGKYTKRVIHAVNSVSSNSQ